MPIINKVELTGRFAPVPTPFTDDGSTVSEIRFSRILRHLSPSVDGFVVCSQTGEFATISLSERKELCEIAIRDSKGKPVLVNASTVGTRAALDLAQHAQRHGARGVICAPPIYDDFSDSEIIGFFQALASYAGTSIYVVDPKNRINSEIRNALERLQPLQWANPLPGGFYKQGTHTDEFECNGCQVSPLHSFGAHISASCGIHQTYPYLGSQRLVKSVLEWQEMECGPLRGPYRDLPADAMASVKALINETNQKRLSA